MEPYILTQKDIEQLASQGLDMNGVPVGAEAEPFEIEALGVQQPEAAPQGLSEQQQAYGAARAAGVAPENAPQEGGIPATTPTPSPAMGVSTSGGNSMLDLLSQPISQDPFENLSRNQRMMIGFAALKDAGFALQGKESGAVKGVMDDITMRADMERKRRMQVAQLEQERARKAQLDAFLMGAAVPAPSGGSTGLGGVGAIDAQIAALKSQIGAYASADQMDLYAQKMAELNELRERGVEEETASQEQEQAITGQLTKARSAISTAKEALAAATGLSGDELQKQLDAGTIDPKSFALVRQGFVPDSRQFKDFQAAASKLGSMLTFSNLDDILKSGVVLGTLSDADFRIIGNLTGVIDPINMPEQTAETILQAYISLVEKEKSLEGELSGTDEFNELAKKYSKGGKP